MHKWLWQCLLSINIRFLFTFSRADGGYFIGLQADGDMCGGLDFYSGRPRYFYYWAMNWSVFQLNACD